MPTSTPLWVSIWRSAAQVLPGQISSKGMCSVLTFNGQAYPKTAIRAITGSSGLSILDEMMFPVWVE